MNSVWAITVLIVGAVALSLVVVCLIVLRRVERVSMKRQRELEEQVSALEDAVRILESCLAEAPAKWSSPEEAQKSASIVAALEAAAEEESVGEAIEPEIQAALAAAAVAAVGPKARIKSAREIKAREDASAWSQQGRVLVQASHNLGLRR